MLKPGSRLRRRRAIGLLCFLYAPVAVATLLKTVDVAQYMALAIVVLASCFGLALVFEGQDDELVLPPDHIA